MATQFFGVSKSLQVCDIIGELLEIEPGKSGLSLLDTDQSMCLEKCDIVRGHIIFAQANSLANAIIDSQVSVTGKADIKYLRMVRAGERLIAKARIVDRKGHRIKIETIVRSKEEIVFIGKFTIYGMNLETAEYLHILKEIE